jgi:hypothetical protein
VAPSLLCLVVPGIYQCDITLIDQQSSGGQMVDHIDPSAVHNGYVTVYVYKYGGQGPKAMTVALARPWFGLTADSEEELHQFAGELGLDRQLYRPRTAGSEVLPVVGHYDLDEAERNRAVALGAQVLATREYEKRLRRMAKEWGIKLR